MAFAEASGSFTFNHSTFVDNSNINKDASSNEKKLNGKGLQLLLNASSTEASFDSQARHPPPLCHPSTRTGLLDHIFEWIDAGEENILFLDGPAGAGKSAVAQTVAAHCAAKGMLAASYFFFRGSPSRNNIAPLVATIAYQMGSSATRGRKKLKKAMEDDPSILDKSLDVQLRKLVLDLYQLSLFESVWFKVAKPKQHLLVIDGLDECNNDNDQRRVVILLGQLVNSIHLRCLITSRPEPHIVSAVTSLSSVTRVTLNEHSWDATGDIRTYLHSGFDEISSRMNIPQPWPSDDVINMLVMKAGGMFIYASTVLKYIGDPDALPTKRLEHVIHLSPGTTPFAELDQLYQQILMACPLQHRPTLLHIFGFIFLQNPAFKEEFDVSLIEALLGLSRGEVAVVLRKMHSILAVGNSGTKHIIKFYHKSLGDFIFDRERSGPFFIDRLKESLFLAGKCIDNMGHYGGTGLHNQVELLHDTRIIYAWSSWFYHGERAGDSYFVDLVEKLCCDKTSSTEAVALADSNQHIFMDGLAAGISWVESRRGENTIDVLISELTSVRKKLIRNHTKGVVASPETPLFILRAFEDPGIEFFQLHEHTLVILERGDNTSTVLCFKCHGKFYDLADSLVAAGTLPHRSSRRAFSQHRHMAVHCIRILRGVPKRWPTACFQYASKYWTKHLSLSNTNDDILEELRQIRLQETPRKDWITQSPADAFSVIQWLQGVPHSKYSFKLALLWDDNLEQLRYHRNSSRGLRPSRPGPLINGQ